LRQHGAKTAIRSSKAMNFSVSAWSGAALFYKNHNDAKGALDKVEQRNKAASAPKGTTMTRAKLTRLMNSRNYTDANVFVSWGHSGDEVLPERLKQLLASCLRA
jgi:hypothetical protein